MRTILSSFNYIKNEYLHITLTSQMLMFSTKDAHAKLTVTRLTLVEGSSLATYYRRKSGYPKVKLKGRVPVVSKQVSVGLSGSAFHASRLQLDFTKTRTEKFWTTVSLPCQLMSNTAGRANPPLFLLLLFLSSELNSE